MSNAQNGARIKAWAGKVTRAFGGRGIEVTTKHNYDIDFKYVWECTACGLEFKRHSKSIHIDRDRCGVCKSHLRQTKPVPRAAPAKESEYQRFMKEQMSIIKMKNPDSPQKDIMKLVASLWSQKEREKEARHSGDKKLGSAAPPPPPSSQVSSSGKDNKVEGVAKSLNKLTLIDLT